MRKGESTRQRIIEQAAPVFNQRGFAGCTMHDLMEATGLEKGGIYRHFSGKEELAAEAFRYAVARVNKLRSEKTDRTHGALQQLRSIVTRFVDVRSDIAGGCIIFNTAIEEDDGNPVLRALALEAVRDWKARLVKIVQQGIRNGEIRSGTVPRAIANVVIATLEGALAISRLEGTRTALEDAKVALHTLLDGLAP
ncbi:MAG TPA: TetR/AcrR family transcriptional regulator [Terracidiphilus sp.]|jgi:AcrR family transcriptional regulator